MTRGRIVMAVSDDLATDQRVARHCRTLAAAGYEVLLIGRRWEDEPCLADDAPYATDYVVMRRQRGWRYYARLNWLLARRIRKEKADIVWANDTDTLPACRLGAWGRPTRLVMDAHEIFPEVPEIVHKPLVQTVWRTLERWLMPRCAARLTVCESLAQYYRQRLGVEMTVVRNMPERPPRPVARGERGTQPVLLYQGALNVGRGVDWAIDALQWLPHCRLTVVGSGDVEQELRRYAAQKPWADRITFAGRMRPEALETLEADVGLVMLEDMGLSYHYALPNRIGDFVWRGIPMVVSDLPEMAAFVKRHRVGEVMRGTGAKALAESVGRVLARRWTDEDFGSARRDMDWEKEKKKLLASIEFAPPQN